MSQDFRNRYQQMRDSDPTAPADKPGNTDHEPESGQYGSQSNVRNLCLVWPEGRRLFLNYSYLVSAEYLPDENMITVTFTTHTVLLKGIRLKELFDDLMSHLSRLIICAEARYNPLAGDGPVVNDITVAQHK